MITISHSQALRTVSSLLGLCLATQVALGAVPKQKTPPLQPITRDRAEVAAVLAQAPTPTAADAAKPMTIVLVADIKDHLADVRAHHYPLWQERWARLLGGSGAWGQGPVKLYGEAANEPAGAPGVPGVRVIKAEQWPSPQQFEVADVVVVFCYIKWDASRLEELRRYLDRDKGFVAIHSAVWTKPAPSAAVGAITGVGGFRFYRHGVVKLRVDRAEHPICVGLPREIELRDETYWPVTPDPEVPGFTVLASSPEQTKPGEEPTTPQPIFWVSQPNAGRVFGSVLGHFTWTFDDPYFRLLLLRGIAWAAGASPYRFDSLVNVP
jgi:type 1 glutamine amidotransferase